MLNNELAQVKITANASPSGMVFGFESLEGDSLKNRYRDVNVEAGGCIHLWMAMKLLVAHGA